MTLNVLEIEFVALKIEVLPYMRDVVMGPGRHFITLQKYVLVHGDI